jgi:drug/metabolite transporter (DMT)-like permease
VSDDLLARPAGDAKGPSIAVSRDTDSTRRLLSYGALAISVIGVGSALVFVRLSEVDATATLMLRMAAATLLAGGLALPQARSVGVARVSRSDWRLLLISSVISCLDLLANHWAVFFTSVANVALLIDTTPVFVLILSILVFHERHPATRFLALGAILAGAVLVIVGGGSLPSLAAGQLAGDLLALTSAILYAVYLLITRDLRARVPALVVMLCNSTVTAVVLLPVAALTSPRILPYDLRGYLIIFFLAAISQLLGHGLMTYALRTVQAGLASVSTLFRPVVAALLGWLVLGQRLGWIQLVGAVVILGGLAWFQLLRPVQKR